MEENQVNEERHPPRVCPRCNSDNTKFCYYNNYSESQPRYKCKDCRRFWTLGGALRNVPIGGSARRVKRTTMIDQPSGSQVVSLENQQVTHQPSFSQVVPLENQQVNYHQPFLHNQETNEFLGTFDGSSSSSSNQQVNHHQPFLHNQETNEFLGTFAGSSSSAAAVNPYGFEFPDDIITNVPPLGDFPPMEALHISDVSFGQGYYDVGSNDLFGNPMVNQSIGGSVVVSPDHNIYPINQEDPNMWNQSFNNTMNMDHNASTSGSKGKNPKP